jgi:hypothetical protein
MVKKRALQPPAQPRTAQCSVDDMLFAVAVAEAREQHEIEEYLRNDGPGVVKIFEGDSFKLARAANPGKWVRQLLLQRDAEKDHFDKQLAKELESISSTSKCNPPQEAGCRARQKVRPVS